MQKFTYLWCGEFGWEVTHIVPMMNAALEKFETTIVSYPSAKGLYEDMNVKFISHDFPQRLCGLKGGLKEKIQKVADAIEVESDTFCIGCNTSCARMKSIGAKPKVIREDLNPKKRNQVVIHARKISTIDKFDKAKYKRDWRDGFDKSVRHIKSHGFEIGFIGLPDQSICLHELGHDWRTKDVSETIVRIKESTFMFGPSSGPFVLSVFCLTPIFTWWCRDFRLFHNNPGRWNPFATPHYHPWSGDETDFNLNQYQKNYNVDPSVINSGIDWMLSHGAFL